MKSFFNRLGSASNVGTGKKTGPSEEDVQKVLAQAQACLARLRNAKEEDFPLLNESTRLVQHLDASVTQMPEGETRSVWKQQVTELQGDLKAATEKMLSREMPATQSSQSGPSMFEGLNLDAPGGTPSLPQADQDIFSGLSFGGGPPPQSPLDTAAALQQKSREALGSITSQPLPEDLFSGLDALSPSGVSAPDPFQQSNAASDPFAAQPSTLLPGAATSPPDRPDDTDSKRKKRILRRVGRDRDPVEGSKASSNQEAAQVAAGKLAQRHSKEAPRPGERGPDLPSSASSRGRAPPDLLSPASEGAAASPPTLPFKAAAADESSPGPAAVSRDGSRSEAAKIERKKSSPAEDSLELIAEDEQKAKKQRRRLKAEAAKLSEKLARLRDAEAGAVEAEDFENAASLSAESDSAQQQLNAVQQRAEEAERAVDAVDVRRWAASRARAAELRGEAEALEQASKQHSSAAEAGLLAAEQAEQQRQKQQAAALDRAEELGNRTAARRRWLAEERSAVERKIEEATRPLAVQQKEQAAAVEALLEEVAELRKALADKEAALQAAQSAAAATESRANALASKFDSSLERLVEDEQQLEAEEADLEAEKQRVRDEGEQLDVEKQEAASEAARLRSQAAEAKAQAEGLLATAAALEARADAEQQAGAAQKDLRAALESARASLQGAQSSLDTAQAAAKGLAARRSALHAAAVAAEEQAAAAKRRVPEVEAGKKDAAAARDFKEAARLSAEAKTLATTVQTNEAAALESRRQAAAAEAEEEAASKSIARAREALASAEQEAGLQKWRLLKAAAADASRQLEAASAAEAYAEADALQVEIDEADREARSLASRHGFVQEETVDETRGNGMPVLSSEPAAERDRSKKEDREDCKSSRLEDVPEASAASGPEIPPSVKVSAPEPEACATPRWSIDVPGPEAVLPQATVQGRPERELGAGEVERLEEAAATAAQSQDARVPRGFPTLSPAKSRDLPLPVGAVRKRVDESSSGAAPTPKFPSLGPRVSVGMELNMHKGEAEASLGDLPLQSGPNIPAPKPVGDHMTGPSLVAPPENDAETYQSRGLQLGSPSTTPQGPEQGLEGEPEIEVPVKLRGGDESAVTPVGEQLSEEAGGKTKDGVMQIPGEADDLFAGLSFA